MTEVDDGGGRMLLKLEGRLADQWVDELARAAPAIERARNVTFDLDGLSFVDQRGVALLRDAESHGARLTGGSTFIAALIQDPCR